MAEFFNTGIDMEYLTVGIVTLALIIAIILPLSIYQLQKLRPKLKIGNIHSNNYHEEHVMIIAPVTNIGHIVAEGVKFTMISKTKGVIITQNHITSTDIMEGGIRALQETVSIKKGEKCKIKLEISWDNHTSKLKKRDKITHEFICNRTEVQVVKIEKS